MAGPRRKTLEMARRTDDGPVRLEGRVIVVADDDRGIRAEIRAALNDTQYTVIECDDGAQALTAVRQKQPDLLLLDVEMPTLGGVDVCRIVKANQGATGFGFIPVILMTARRTSGKVEGLELGADDYLVKPFDPLELSARVKSMLRLKALQDTLLEKNRELDEINRELEKSKSELERLSRTDGLTGLINRRHFDERLELEFSRAVRYRSPLSCLMMDIDHFKKVNDTWGHQFGDVVIRETSGVARRTLRDVDVLARYGGEEIIALLPETPLEEAWRVAERVRQGVEAMRLVCRTVEPAQTVKFTVSIGVATYPGHDIESGQGLLQLADECLYAAKQNGRNQVCQPE